MSLAEQMDTVTEASAGTVDRHATAETFDREKHDRDEKQRRVQR